ncbi:MAG: hypothetical protein Q9220_007518 [cf. Caloplaca sp. 1 TL-2023]
MPFHIQLRSQSQRLRTWARQCRRSLSWRRKSTAEGDKTNSVAENERVESTFESAWLQSAAKSELMEASVERQSMKPVTEGEWIQSAANCNRTKAAIQRERTRAATKGEGMMTQQAVDLSRWTNEHQLRREEEVDRALTQTNTDPCLTETRCAFQHKVKVVNDFVPTQQEERELVILSESKLCNRPSVDSIEKTISSPKKSKDDRKRKEEKGMLSEFLKRKDKDLANRDLQAPIDQRGIRPSTAISLSVTQVLRAGAAMVRLPATSIRELFLLRSTRSPDLPSSMSTGANPCLRMTMVSTSPFRVPLC